MLKKQDNLNIPNKNTLNIPNKNTLNIPNNKNIFLQDYLVIEHVINIYWKNINSTRYLHTKKIFQFYKDLRNLLATYKIILNFVIVGSNNDESYNLFKEFFYEKSIDKFNDLYLEFNQNNIDSTIKDKNIFFNMLNNKWKYGLKAAIYSKESDIIVMRGSNDLIDPNIYFQIASQFEKKINKLYISTKSIHELKIYNWAVTLESNGNYINYTKNKNYFTQNYIWDNQYRKNETFDFSEIFKTSIATIGFIGLNKNGWKNLIKSSFNNYLHEIELEHYIRNNITNITTITLDTFFFNIKVNEEITCKSETLMSTRSELYNISDKLMKQIYSLIDYYNTSNCEILYKYLKDYFEDKECKIFFEKKIINNNISILKQAIPDSTLKYYKVNEELANFANVIFSFPK